MREELCKQSSLKVFPFSGFKQNQKREKLVENLLPQTVQLNRSFIPSDGNTETFVYLMCFIRTCWKEFICEFSCHRLKMFFVFAFISRNLFRPATYLIAEIIVEMNAFRNVIIALTISLSFNKSDQGEKSVSTMLRCKNTFTFMRCIANLPF